MKRYIDLIFVLLLNIVLIILNITNINGEDSFTLSLKIIISIFYLTFIPGYAFQSALLVHRKHLTQLERIAISIGLSIAVMPILGLALDGPFGGIRLWQSLVFLSLFTMTSCIVAIYRRVKFGVTEDTELEEQSFREWWQAQNNRGHVVFLGLTLVFIIVSVVGIANFSTLKQDNQMTEFYILGPEGVADDYPREAKQNEPVVLNIGVINHQGTNQDYYIVVRNNSEILATLPQFSLVDGQSFESELSITLPTAGLQRAEILLMTPSSIVYRRLYILLQVNQ